MSLRDEVMAQKREQHPLCRVKVVSAALPEEDAKELAEMLADPLIRSTWIVRALRARGFEIGESSVERHRSGGCRCGTA